MPNRILLSRSDSIGDVVLTLPMAGVLKRLYPNAQILFLGQTYTQPIINACEHVDEFCNWDEVKNNSPFQQSEFFKNINADLIIHIFPRKEIARAAKRARIPIRFGTTNRIYHWNTCNKFVRLSRTKSSYHEAQLNLKLLRPFGAKELYTRKEISGLYGFSNV